MSAVGDGIEVVMPGWISMLSLLLLGSLASLWIYWSLGREDEWSISIYTGRDPFSLQPHPLIANHPVLSAADVTDTRARFVADPFLIRHGACWHMFFEVLETRSRRGLIALASSKDARSWRYERVVLREPFHLSYPYVFEHRGTYYMLPETGEADAIRLYRAVEYPSRWELFAQLLQGAFWDPSLIFRDNKWWLFALDATASLTLHSADRLEGPWYAHPRSPVVRNSVSVARPGGRLIEYAGSLVRFAQDGVPTYGSRLRAFQIDELTSTEYREHELAASPILSGTGSGWNAVGMHQIDPVQLADGTWLASVDGNRRPLVLNWRAGARRIVNMLCLRAPRGRGNRH
jgi:hypothetical protein